jgi:excisionase family DNA binding protein
MNWLSPKSIGKKLDMSSKTVLRMIDDGELPAITFKSGRRRVSEEALERYLKKLERPPTHGGSVRQKQTSLTLSTSAGSSDGNGKTTYGK